ncbi:MAG TPA: hypothetical protein VN680_09815 [Burkholderiaceae bacterium]|jgi:hypothetical protein|nr:hypothetical protein [Burkholderiaceae bacterium]
MDFANGLMLLGGALALIGLSWCASAWWYGRKVETLQRKLDKLRQVAAMNAQQTRRQIAQLQHELATRPRIKVTTATEAKQSAADDRRTALERELDAAPQAARPANGFADTQPLPAMT